MTGDRGRDTSRELTEVRTVYGRAITALADLERFVATGEPSLGHWDFTVDPPAYVRDGDNFDPDRDEMIVALRRVVALLEPWKRTGRKPQ